MPAKQPTKAEEIKNIVNTFLKEDVFQMASDARYVVEYLSTGLFPIDTILQGGLPRGRFTEIYGDYSTLKSYIALFAIATTQAAGGVCALVDTEHSFDPEWAARLGVDVNQLIIVRPPSGEEACDASELLIRQGVDLIVWDSVAATMPQDESKKRMGKENIQPARLAAFMSTASRRLTTANRNTAVLFINQTRLNVGVIFGDPTVVSGGRAMGYYASYRLGLKSSGKIKVSTKKQVPGDTPDTFKEADGKLIVAHKITATVEKSKLSAPYDSTVLVYDLRTARLDETGFIIARGLENGWIKKKGQMYQVGQRKPVHGTKGLRGLLETTPAAVDHLKQLILPGSPAGTPQPAKRRVVVRRSKPPKR